MSGAVTGFQRTYTFKANGENKEVGINQAVVYSANMREVEVPEEDNLVPVGIVTYQHEERDGASVAVQLDRIGLIPASEEIQFGDEIIVGAGGKAKKAQGLAPGTVANILGEAQNTVAIGELVQVLIRPKAKTV